MWNVFNKPYPFNDNLNHNTKIIFFTSIGVFGFLFLFQPFSIDTLPVKEKFYLIAGLSVITFLSLSLNLLIIPSLVPKAFSSNNWNIKKEILWDIWILITTLGGYFLLNNSMGVMNFGFYLFVKLILVAVIPLSVWIIVNHNKMLRANLKLADELSKKLKENKSIQDKMVYFNSDYQKDSLAIKVSFLLLIRSANNYIEVFWKEGETCSESIGSLQRCWEEEALKDHKFIFKCHRSFMVNINYIDKIEGNSQGYKLIVENLDFPIPISKNTIVKLKELI